MLVIGIVVLVVGLFAAGALWFVAAARYDDNLDAFARAPAGCSTTLDFERTGDFTLYVETTGMLADVAGDCPAETEYDRDDVPAVTLTLTAPDGSGVDIASNGSADYDNGTFVGEAVGVVRIDEPGDYVLTVPSSGAPFAIAIGGAPDEGVTLLRLLSALVAVASLAGGIALVVAGTRRPEAPPPAPPSFTAPGWPTSPPGFPAPPPTTGASGPPAATPPDAASPGASGPPVSPGSWQPPSWGPPPAQ
jgi:hypothetical protein